jgi:hypothetical protein
VLSRTRALRSDGGFGPNQYAGAGVDLVGSRVDPEVAPQVSHGSGRAGLPHPALRSTGSLGA